MDPSEGTTHSEQLWPREAPKELAARCTSGAEHPFLDTSLFLLSYQPLSKSGGAPQPDMEIVCGNHSSFLPPCLIKEHYPWNNWNWQSNHCESVAVLSLLLYNAGILQWKLLFSVISSSVSKGKVLLLKHAGNSQWGCTESTGNKTSKKCQPKNSWEKPMEL